MISNKYEKLDVGGSSGSIKGNFFEYHFGEILKKAGYIIVPKNSNLDITSFKQNEVFHLYRIPPDKFTEIDFYLPSKNIGFCVTNLSRIERFRLKKKKINEFNSVQGNCPHCNKKFENKSSIKNIYERWKCIHCKQIIFPFDLKNPIATNGEELIKVNDKSASLQAHKQCYYRLGELIDIKTSSKNLSCIEIIYNNEFEWRNWSKVMKYFFDESYFVFDNIKTEKFGSTQFDNKFVEKVKKIINDPPQPNKLTNEIIQKFNEIKNNKKLTYRKWIEKIEKNRIKIWGENKPISYPIRYSIYNLIRENGTVNDFVNTEIYEIIVKFLSKRITHNNIKKLTSENKLLFYKYYDQTKKKINAQGLEYKKKCEDLFVNFIKKIKMDKIDNNIKKDFWFKNYKEKIIDLLEYIYKISIKNYWYKFIMISRNDYESINSTPFIDYQYEPLEILINLKLKELKKKDVVKEIYEIAGSDFKEDSWISKLPFANKPIRLGSDFCFILKNNKQVYIQCKSNTSFKKWSANQNTIANSGITYKDSKRMIAHNLLSSFRLNNNKLSFKKERIYIAIIDGNWCSNKKDIYKLIRLMYYLGVNDIFFADEIDTVFQDYLIKMSRINKI